MHVFFFFRAAKPLCALRSVDKLQRKMLKPIHADKRRHNGIYVKWERAMTMTIQATFDGEVLRPMQPLPLPANTMVRITIESDESTDGRGPSFLGTARSLNLKGPPDWSSRLEDYLYGDHD